MRALVSMIGPSVVYLPASLLPEAAEEFERTVSGLIASGHKQILLDCSRLDHLYSGHVRLMWMALEACREQGAALQLVAVRPDIVRVLRLLDLLDFFPYRMSDRDQGYADSIAPSGEAVREGLTRFTAYLRQSDVPEIVATDARTIFFEIASNILHHGHLDASEVIIVTAVLSSTGSMRELEIRFTDNGIPFDSSRPQPKLDPEAAAEQRRRRGFGLLMVERLADSISYERFLGTFNVLTATKRWQI